ncbi:hypothetical protein PHJA_002384500 [Phtheirospermum japonicum]|uniref:Uncharacterized protein n=1 Tax=Phtheirospermum japonicum TaxID=374723 RepID=A0A830D1X7_9LAMI|nr:hypothetical protein PHJA_002384500 [Phtheirospermum japonicum]
MLRRRTTAVAILSRHLYTTNAKPFSKIPWKYRSKAIKDSQKALTDYLHATRSLPFLYADNIARNSPQSLWKTVSKIPFSPSSFSCSFQRILRYHPINELDFFFESIGLNCDGSKIPNIFFLSDFKHFDVACALAGMGFPWSKLGLLCKDGFFIFESDPLDLKRKINEIKNVYGFNSVTIISICLAFPRVLHNNDEMDGLLSDLKILFLDYDLWSSVEGGYVDDVFGVCLKIKSFYDSGCEMGKIGELMGRSKTVLIEHTREDLISKIDFFRKLDVRKDEIGGFLLARPEIFSFDLGNRVVSISGFLEQLGLSENELEPLKQKYPHVFGKNRVANLPSVMRSLDLSEWFFEKMKNGGHSLLGSYTIKFCPDVFDRHYEEGVIKIQTKRTHFYAFKKLNFLHSIGFGENKFAVDALPFLNGSDHHLRQRFDCLLRCGVEYSKLCAMVKLAPKILNQQERSIEKKIKYLCNDMGATLDYLEVFPGYLCYDLENRIKPRFKFHKWLVEKGLCRKKYSLTTLIACSEKAYVERLFRINRDAAMMWQENRADWTVG